MFDSHYMKQNISNDTNKCMITSSELFKLNYFDNQGWTQLQTESSSTSREQIRFNYDEDNEEQLDTSRIHLRHFSANDRRVRNSTYSPSTSSSSFSLQQNVPLSLNADPMYNLIPSAAKSEKIIEFDKQQRRLRFEIILEAATAVTQKAEESAITYLNRGQVYGIQLNDKQGLNETITSTLSIAFHSSSHRRIAESYWKFWISQQKQREARAIDIDASQSTGISDLSFPSFDKIKFNWNGRFGSKIHVRFKCLSTDFSRIKGVKGIPLRTQMESHVSGDNDTEKSAVDEICFCKVKLFRDKGAERKNKDDAKQISKQLEKVYGKANEQSLPLMYNVSLPYSVFGEIPTSSTLDTFEHAADDLKLPLQMKKSARYHTRVMTAPNSLVYRNNNSNALRNNGLTLSSKSTSGSPLTRVSVDPINSNNKCATFDFSPSPVASSLAATPVPDSFAAKTKENYDFYSFLTQQQQALAALPSIDTNNLSFDADSHAPSLLMENGANCPENTVHVDDDLPPLSADTLYTPGTMQATPTEYTYQHHHSNGIFAPFEKNLYSTSILTPELITDPPTSSPTFVYDQHSQVATQGSAPATISSIYDVFTPEEIQQPLGSCSITPTQEEEYYTLQKCSPAQPERSQRDYFCSMEATASSNNDVSTTASSCHISLLQQQLQLHNETASSIILNSNAVSSMLLLSPPQQRKQLAQQQTKSSTTSIGIRRRKSKRQRVQEGEETSSSSNNIDASLPFSSNPSHVVTLNSTKSYQSDSNSIVSPNQPKKRRYYSPSPVQ